MNATDRRMEIISILVVSGHVTAGELAQEFSVTRRTILNDVVALTYGYPIYTKQGAGIDERYAPTVRMIFDLAKEGWHFRNPQPYQHAAYFKTVGG